MFPPPQICTTLEIIFLGPQTSNFPGILLPWSPRLSQFTEGTQGQVETKKGDRDHNDQQNLSTSVFLSVIASNQNISQLQGLSAKLSMSPLEARKEVQPSLLVSLPRLGGHAQSLPISEGQK
jgi:hypothetical protein